MKKKSTSQQSPRKKGNNAEIPKLLQKKLENIKEYLPLPKAMLAGAILQEDFEERLELDVKRYGAEYGADTQQIQQGTVKEAQLHDLVLILVPFVDKSHWYYLAKCIHNKDGYIAFQFYDNAHRDENIQKNDYINWYTNNDSEKMCILQRETLNDTTTESKGDTQKQIIKKMAEDQVAQNELMQKHVTEIKTMVESLKRPAPRDQHDKEVLQALQEIKETLKQPKTSIGQPPPTQHQLQVQQQQFQPFQMTWPQQQPTWSQQPSMHPSRIQHPGARALPPEQDRQHPQLPQAAQVSNSGYHRQENWMSPYQPAPQLKVNERNTHLQAVIRGVPYKKDENLREIVDNIIQLKCLHGGAFTGQVNPRAIYQCDYTCKRALKENTEPDPSKKSPPPIIATFKTVQQKMDFIRDLFKDKKANDQHMTINNVCPDLATEDNKTDGIYINENLTLEQSNLFYTARQLKRTTGKPDLPYLYVWTKNGTLYVKKSDADRAQLILHAKDLDQG